MMKILKEKVKVLKEYRDEDIEIANKTARKSGASALNPDGTIRAIVPKYVAATTDKDASILDFGAGSAAIHTIELMNQGFTNVTAYDFGNNVVEGIHDPHALANEYQTVFASNVLNVSSNEEMLRDTLADIWGCVKPGGRAVFNYPSSPRKGGFTTQEVADIIQDVTGKVPEKCGGTNSAPIWEVYK